KTWSMIFYLLTVSRYTIYYLPGIFSTIVIGQCAVFIHTYNIFIIRTTCAAVKLIIFYSINFPDCKRKFYSVVLFTNRWIIFIKLRIKLRQYYFCFLCSNISIFIQFFINKPLYNSAILTFC